MLLCRLLQPPAPAARCAASQLWAWAGGTGAPGTAPHTSVRLAERASAMAAHLQSSECPEGQGSAQRVLFALRELPLLGLILVRRPRTVPSVPGWYSDSWKWPCTSIIELLAWHQYR